MVIVDENQQQINELYITLSRTISNERLGAYLVAAGFNHERALNLYLWNAKMCGAFYLPLQATEVGLRNGVNAALSNVYGNEWWRNPNEFVRNADRSAQNAIRKVIRRINDKSLPLTTAQVVAGLSFGFWVNILDSYYNREVWSRELHVQFPNMPDDATRELLKSRAARTADFRNRVSHHEPMHKSNVSGEYSELMKLLSWICPHKKEWIRANSTVPRIMREKP